MTPEAEKLRKAILDMASLYGCAERDWAFAVADVCSTARASRASRRRFLALARLTDALARLTEAQAAISAVRRLCESYTPVPPPLFADPPTARGEGFNDGTKTMAVAVLGAIDDAMGGQR